MFVGGIGGRHVMCHFAPVPLCIRMAVAGCYVRMSRFLRPARGSDHTRGKFEWMMSSMRFQTYHDGIVASDLGGRLYGSGTGCCYSIGIQIRPA